MNWLKVGAVVIGGVVVFFVVDSVIHLFLGLLTAIAFIAIVGGGVYAASKILGSRHRQELPTEPGYFARQDDEPAPASRPAPGTSVTRRPDVEDELSRLKREMGQ